jgi:chorismate synthase
MINFEFFGTSHGEGYGGTITGLPEGFAIDVDAVNHQLHLRKCGYGRSVRQSEAADSVEFSGLVEGKTAGALSFFVKNAEGQTRTNFSAVRPNHVDLVGSVKHASIDLRALNELASARNSLCYVVLGAICRQILAEKYGIQTYSYTREIGGVRTDKPYIFGKSDSIQGFETLHCHDILASVHMCRRIDECRDICDSVGGVTVVGATGVKMGQIGDFFPYSRRLDGIIAGHMLALPSVKGLEFGLGREITRMTGFQAADKLTVAEGDIAYATNNAGGIVAGITTGADIVFSLTVKPVPTVEGVQSYDLVTQKPTTAQVERADTCVVPNVGVIAENVLAYVLLEELSHDK